MTPKASSQSPSENFPPQAGAAEEPDQGVRATSNLPEAVERMRRRTASLRDSTDPPRRDGLMVTRCAWCDRIALGEQWLRHEDFRNQHTPALDYRITHGICPECLAGVKAVRASTSANRSRGGRK